MSFRMPRTLLVFLSEHFGFISTGARNELEATSSVLLKLFRVASSKQINGEFSLSTWTVRNLKLIRIDDNNDNPMYILFSKDR